METPPSDLQGPDRAHLKLALALARNGEGPARVGAVIASGAVVLSTGFKGERPGMHAEQVALAKAAENSVNVEGATLYTTLEPCANLGTGRVPCAQLIAEAKIATVFIATYDRNPRIYRHGWRLLRDAGVALRDFPADLREEARALGEVFDSHFTEGFGSTGGAKFDWTQNGGRFTIHLDESPDVPAWETQWTTRGSTSIYAYGGYPGHVALARFARDFVEIDDPDALDYAGSSVPVGVGEIVVFRNEHGHVLCRVEAIEPTADYGGGGHASLKLTWQARPASKD